MRSCFTVWWFLMLFLGWWRWWRWQTVVWWCSISYANAIEQLGKNCFNQDAATGFGWRASFCYFVDFFSESTTAHENVSVAPVPLAAVLAILSIPCAYLVWLFGLFNNLNKYGCELCMGLVLCVNALWISVDFSSKKKKTTIAASIDESSNGCICWFWYYRLRFGICDSRGDRRVFRVRVRTIWINMPKRSIKICLLVMDLAGSDFRRFHQPIFDSHRRRLVHCLMKSFPFPF